MKIQRLPLMLLCLSLAVAVTTHVARAQTPVPKPVSPPLQVAGSTHHVKGSVEIGTCELSSLNGVTMRVVENWYRETPGMKRDLSLPRNGGALAPLTFTGKALVQDRVLGSVTLTDAPGFDVQWSEPATGNRKPWVVNAQNGGTGEYLTVYRLLRLEVVVSGQGRLMVGAVKPTIVIQFFGSETTKDVGVVKVDCETVG